jgi:hypothetical protein
MDQSPTDSRVFIPREVVIQEVVEYKIVGREQNYLILSLLKPSSVDNLSINPPPDTIINISDREKKLIKDSKNILLTLLRVRDSSWLRIEDIKIPNRS